MMGNVFPGGREKLIGLLNIQKGLHEVEELNEIYAFDLGWVRPLWICVAFWYYGFWFVYYTDVYCFEVDTYDFIVRFFCLKGDFVC